MKNYRLISGHNGLLIILLLAACLVFPSDAPAAPATYDASGTWLHWVTAGDPVPPYSGCESHDSIGFATITQKSNGEVELALNGKSYDGSVSVATYIFDRISYPDGVGTTYVDLQFTLTSNSYATGTVYWEYWEYGYLYCYGTDTLIMKTVASYDQAPQFFNTSGLWDYTVTDQWNNCGDTPAARSGTISINQNGDTFTYTDEYGIHTGLVSNDDYICTLTYPEGPGVNYEATFFNLSDNSHGSGSISWTYVEGSYECSGGGTFTMTKRTAPPVYDASGYWEASFGGNSPVVAIFSQDGDTITWVNPSNNFVASGFVSGTVYTVIGTYPHSYNGSQGTMTESLTFNLSTFYGELTWTWSDGGLPQYGTIPFTLTYYDDYDNIPNEPTLISPSDDSTNVSLAPTLTTASFSHADSNATHSLTEWQISTRNDLASTVFQKATDSNLLSLQVPRATLGISTTYYWRVRHYDGNYRASQWSEIYSFTTTSTTNDLDDNGIPDDQELDDPNIDLDNDGTSDIYQEKYRVLKDITDNPVGISHKLSNTVSSIDTVEALDPAVVSNVARPSMPNGLLTIISTFAKPTDNGELTVYFPSAVPAGGIWYMHDPIDGWVDYSNWSVFAPDRKSITIKLKDWGFGDSDGIPNGRLVDPGGIGFPTFMDLTVKDAITGLVIPEAVVTIGDLTLDTSNCAGDCLSMIVPGTYDITVTAPDYNTVVVKDVVISEGVDVVKNFSIRPSRTGALSAILGLLLD